MLFSVSGIHRPFLILIKQKTAKVEQLVITLKVEQQTASVVWREAKVNNVIMKFMLRSG